MIMYPLREVSGGGKGAFAHVAGDLFAHGHHVADLYIYAMFLLSVTFVYSFRQLFHQFFEPDVEQFPFQFYHGAGHEYFESVLLTLGRSLAAVDMAEVVPFAKEFGGFAPDFVILVAEQFASRPVLPEVPRAVRR
jgi:hypothetical protein